MANVELEIEIRPDGDVVVKVEGAKGKACLDYAKLLEQIIGKEKSRELTSEYYEPDAEVAQDLHLDQNLKR